MEKKGRGRPKKTVEEKLKGFLDMGYEEIDEKNLEVGMEICVIGKTFYITENGKIMTEEKFKLGGIISVINRDIGYCMVRNRTNSSVIFSCQLGEYIDPKDELKKNNRFYYNPLYIPADIRDAFKGFVVNYGSVFRKILNVLSEKPMIMNEICKLFQITLNDKELKELSDVKEAIAKPKKKKDKTKILKKYRKLYGTLIDEGLLMEKIMKEHPNWELVDIGKRKKKKEKKSQD